MKFLNPIQNFINNRDTRTFYIYVMGYAGGCLALCILIIIYYYSSVRDLEKKIKNIGESREEVRDIFEKYAIVKQQQALVEDILAKDPNFKIVGYFKKLLEDIHLTNKMIDESVTTTDLEENYRKSELTIKFEGMSMKDLTILLEKIEQNSRVATNRLDIVSSKKNNKTIDVTLTISTLLPKIESSSSKE
jgi:hypothetical protein